MNKIYIVYLPLCVVFWMLFLTCFHNEGKIISVTRSENNEVRLIYRQEKYLFLPFMLFMERINYSFKPQFYCLHYSTKNEKITSYRKIKLPENASIRFTSENYIFFEESGKTYIYDIASEKYISAREGFEYKGLFFPEASYLRKNSDCMEVMKGDSVLCSVPVKDSSLPWNNILGFCRRGNYFLRWDNGVEDDIFDNVHRLVFYKNFSPHPEFLISSRYSVPKVSWMIEDDLYFLCTYGGNAALFKNDLRLDTLDMASERSFSPGCIAHVHDQIYLADNTQLFLWDYKKRKFIEILSLRNSLIKTLDIHINIIQNDRTPQDL